jgi:hypothetical protein
MLRAAAVQNADPLKWKIQCLSATYATSRGRISCTRLALRMDHHENYDVALFAGEDWLFAEHSRDSIEISGTPFFMIGPAAYYLCLRFRLAGLVRASVIASICERHASLRRIPPARRSPAAGLLRPLLNVET